jgi:hypothetical protein
LRIEALREQLGRQGFRGRWIRGRLRLSDPEEEGQENSLYQYDISIQYENRPEIILNYTEEIRKIENNFPKIPQSLEKSTIAKEFA